MKTEMYMLHVPYAGRKWRGLEKCCCAEPSGLLLFESPQEAMDHLSYRGIDPESFTIVKVTVEHPEVGGVVRWW